jgi:microcystin-dependent protein
MAKNKISEYSSVASNNTDIAGINIAEGCAPSGINNAIRELMAQLKDQQTGTDADSFVVGGAFTCSGAAVFSSTVALGASATATTQSANDNSTKVATTAYVANNAIPSGGIIIWSGSSASIPSGWYLCNGSNSTPDLRDRFVVGAGSTYAVGNTGGSKDAITVSHTHSVTDPGHAHKLLSSGRGMISGGSNTAFFDTYKTTSNLTFQNLTSGSAETNAGSESNTTGISIQSTGDSGTNANLPPYYALCYIMKA